MKKVLIMVTAILALMIVLPTAVSAAADAELPFADVSAGSWYYDNVAHAYEKGLIKGVSDTEFDPDGTLTRGMCAAVLYRAANEPAVGSKCAFTDVKAGSYYADAVAWAQKAGVVVGKTAATFDPDGAITREQFATMLYRYLDAEDLALPETRDGEPADADKVSGYAADAVDNMYKGGVVNGRENGEFDPGDEITRAEMAAMLTRLFDKVVVRWESQRDEYDKAFVSFPGSIFSDDIEVTDLSVGYIPDGYVMHDTYGEWGDEFPEHRMIIICDPDKNPEAPYRYGPGSVCVLFRTDVNEEEYSDECFAISEQITVNGMTAVWSHLDFVLEDEPLPWGRIAFGDDNILVSILYIGVDHEEAIRVAESVFVSPGE